MRHSNIHPPRRPVAVCVAATVFMCCGTLCRGDTGRPPANAELDSVREWLWSNPPDGINRAERRNRMCVIQKAADRFPARNMFSYVALWILSPETADEYENDGILYYLKTSTDHAVEDISRTRVAEGLALWHIYNMGYVFKTPEVCFAIDICLRDGQRIVDELDFLLITHEHADHHAGGLARAMIKAGKPVVSRFGPGSMIVDGPREFRFGPVRVKVDIGDHSPRHPSGRNNMLMFQVDCGESASGCVIYHSGDGANYRKMTPDKPVDVFIPHVACSGMSVAKAIRHIDPSITFVSHVMELTHGRTGSRWSYDYAYDAVGGLPDSEVAVLTWGERWLFPGTVLDD